MNDNYFRNPRNENLSRLNYCVFIVLNPIHIELHIWNFIIFGVSYLPNTEIINGPKTVHPIPMYTKNRLLEYLFILNSSTASKFSQLEEISSYPLKELQFTCIQIKKYKYIFGYIYKNVLLEVRNKYASEQWFI